MSVLIGTSGYSYKAWKGSFYPAKLKPADLLEEFATHLGTVEIDNPCSRPANDRVLEH